MMENDYVILMIKRKVFSRIKRTIRADICSECEGDCDSCVLSNRSFDEYESKGIGVVNDE